MLAMPLPPPLLFFSMLHTSPSCPSLREMPPLSHPHPYPHHMKTPHNAFSKLEEATLALACRLGRNGGIVRFG